MLQNTLVWYKAQLIWGLDLGGVTKNLDPGVFQNHTFPQYIMIYLFNIYIYQIALPFLQTVDLLQELGGAYSIECCGFMLVCSALQSDTYFVG